MTAIALQVSDRPRIGDLLRTLIRTDLKARYHGTIGGFIWALLKPLAMFVVLFGVFSLVFQSDPQYKLNLIIGLFLFDFFSEGTKVGLTSLWHKGYLLTKVRVPSSVIVIASSANAMLTLSVFTIIIGVFVGVTRGLPPPGLLALFFIYLLLYAVMVVAISLATSVLFLRYRDLNQVWDVIMQAGLFFAPIIYPLHIIPEAYRGLVFLWPPTPIVHYSREVLVEQRLPSAGDHLWLIGQVAVLLAMGLLVYRRYAPRSAEYL